MFSVCQVSFKVKTLEPEYADVVNSVIASALA